MDRYRIAPARRPVCLSAAAAGLRSAGAEIGIFTAERYFNAPDVVAPALIHDHDRELSVPAAEAAASQSGRTAASSEASWNSRSGLLSTATSSRQPKSSGGAVYGSGDQAGRASAKGGGSTAGHRSWTLFGRHCPCAGRKAVTVDLASSEPRSPTHARFSPHSAVEECLESDIFKVKVKRPSPPPPKAAAAAAAEERHANMAVKVTVMPGSRAFPVAAADDGATFGAFDAGIGRRAVRSSGGFTFPAPARAVHVGGTSVVVDEPPRVSLEVFQPIDEDAVTLVASPPPPSMPPLTGRAGAALLSRAPPAIVDEEEAMSDASSDLFDLESFAAASSYPTTYRGRGSRRNSADDDDLPYASVSVSAAAEPALSECMYPASEASVVWSVATAEGGAFDAASAASACCVDDLRYVVPEESPDAAGFTAAMSRTAGRKKSGGRGGGGFLSSCRCEKAVSVGPTPMRVVRPPPAAHPGAGAKKGGDGAARYHHGRAHVPVRT